MGAFWKDALWFVG